MTDWQKRRSTIGKSERARTSSHMRVHNQIRFRYVLADHWYASADYMKYFHPNSGQTLRITAQGQPQSSLEPGRETTRSACGSQRARLASRATRQVWQEEIDFRLPLVKQVFTNENSSAGIRYLITDDLALDYD